MTGRRLPLQTARAALKQALTQTHGVLTGLQQVDMRDAWAKQSDGLQKIADGAHASQRQAAFEEHSAAQGSACGRAVAAARRVVL